MTIRNNSKTGTILLAGLATGAAIWYLLGSEKGRNTLTQVSGSLKGFSDNAVTKATDSWSTLKAKVNTYNS